MVKGIYTWDTSFMFWPTLYKMLLEKRSLHWPSQKKEKHHTNILSILATGKKTKENVGHEETWVAKVLQTHVANLY